MLDPLTDIAAVVHMQWPLTRDTAHKLDKFQIPFPVKPLASSQCWVIWVAVIIPQPGVRVAKPVL
jgi:hypothetical protein